MKSADFNKYAAACLIALLVPKVAQEISKALVCPQELEQHQHAFLMADIVSAESAPPAASGPEPIEPLLAQADLARGALLFKQCRQCHTVEQAGINGIGPSLHGVVERAMAKLDKFAYSKAMQQAKGSWNVENLNKFLFKPRAFVSGTKMAFAGISKGQDRADIIAYLQSVSK